MPVTKTNIHDVISYQKPDAEQSKNIVALREAAEEFILKIFDNTPNCADQQASIRYVRMALMTANAAVVLKGLV